MRLTYRILWFEDESDFYESLDFDVLREHLLEKGFELQVTPRTGEETDQIILHQSKKADLIVMDFSLVGGITGDEITKRIRDGHVNTDIVFYSARGVSDLRKAVFDQGLDGIFCR